jgi:hypothetical protein
MRQQPVTNPGSVDCPGFFFVAPLNKRRALRLEEKPRGLAKVAVSPNECLFRDWPLIPFAPIFPDCSLCANNLGTKEARLRKGRGN